MMMSTCCSTNTNLDLKMSEGLCRKVAKQQQVALLFPTLRPR